MDCSQGMLWCVWAPSPPCRLLQVFPVLPRVRAMRLSWEELLVVLWLQAQWCVLGGERRVLDPTEGSPWKQRAGEKQSEEPLAVLEGGVGVVVNSQCKQLLSECTQGRPSWQAAARLPAGDSEAALLSAALQHCHGIPAHLHTHTAPPGRGKRALPFQGQRVLEGARAGGAGLICMRLLAAGSMH